MKIRSKAGRDPAELARLDVHEYLADPLRKNQYVTTLFDVIAPGYDAFTRFFSFGMDRRWKRQLIESGAALSRTDALVLDLACGTCDLAIALASRLRARALIGIDLSRVMLHEARRRPQVGESNVMLVAGDMTHLGIEDSSVDVVSVGYGLRNAARLDASLAEIARVLRSGGVLLSLDFYLPEGFVWRSSFLWYMRMAGSLAGWIWHREPTTYGYLAPSIRAHVTVREFNDSLRRAGFAVERCFRYLGGAIAIHVARRIQAGPVGS